MPLSDLHIHTHYCGHAKGTMEETVSAAIRLGLDEIGFSGHFPYSPGFVEPVPDCVIPEKDFLKYVSEVQELKKTYRDRIMIHLAAEVDYIPGFMEQTKAMCQSFNFDYIIGSVHIVEGVPVDYSEEILVKHIDKLGGVEGLWEKYWHCIEALINLDLCQIIGHLDLPKKFSAANPLFDQSERIDHILDLIRDRDLVLDVNTGGIDRSFQKETYPSVSILRKAKAKGIDVTLGSDAHKPEQVGRYFRETADLLRSLGWENVVVFEGREKQYRSL